MGRCSCSMARTQPMSADATRCLGCQQRGLSGRTGPVMNCSRQHSFVGAPPQTSRHLPAVGAASSAAIALSWRKSRKAAGLGTSSIASRSGAEQEAAFGTSGAGPSRNRAAEVVLVTAAAVALCAPKAARVPVATALRQAQMGAWLPAWPVDRCVPRRRAGSRFASVAHACNSDHKMR